MFLESDEQKPGTYIDKYLVLKTLGKGGNGFAYLTYDRIGDFVTVKVLTSSMVDDERYDEERKRLREEIRVTRCLAHPNIASFVDGSLDPKNHWVATQYIPGESLQQKIQDGLDITHVPYIAARLARALGYVHDQEAVHRDLKPQNVIINPFGEPVLIDFGTVLSEGRAEEVTKVWVGTPQYLAPEQLEEGADSVDRRIDIYKLGVLSWVMFTGNFKPFPHHNSKELLTQISKHIPPLCSETHKGSETYEYVRQFDSLVASMIEKNPTKRPTNSRDIAEEFESYVTSSPRVRFPPFDLYSAYDLIAVKDFPPSAFANLMKMQYGGFIFLDETIHSPQVLDRQSGAIIQANCNRCSHWSIGSSDQSGIKIVLADGELDDLAKLEKTNQGYMLISENSPVSVRCLPEATEFITLGRQGMIGEGISVKVGDAILGTFLTNNGIRLFLNEKLKLPNSNDPGTTQFRTKDFNATRRTSRVIRRKYPRPEK